MIQIKYGNTVLFEVLETPSCERVIELMSADHVKLSWVSREGDSIPAGAYIVYKGETFTLLDEYKPTQKSENEFEYAPEFGSSIMAWGKVPFFLYTTDSQGQIRSREMDWSLTGGANVFLDRICDSIEKETGVTYTYSYDTNLGSKNRQFSSRDILSALNDIANVFETEWWVDKANSVIHLAKCEVGAVKTLTVGGNVKTPSVQLNSEGFYNRYYAFGSTRNIVQSYTGANVNNLVNKRLTLDPEDYPGGYYEPSPIPTGGKVFSKILVFDDIYPAATNFVAYDILSRQEFVLDETTGKKIQIGTDDDGNPIYDMYAVYYIKIGTKSGSTYTQYTINAWEYSEKEDRQEGPQPGREGQLIPGLNVSVHFDSGSLRGREFEVRYITTEETYSGGTPITVTPGYFEIKYTKDGNYIIPDITSLFPKTDDKVILFNLRMPDEYIEDAYGRLEQKMLDTIAEKFDADLNLYTVSSNPIAFEDDDPNLGIGSKVKLINGDYSLNTRVTKLVSRIDFPYVQTITVGNSLVKGTIQELKEEVTNANTNLEIIATLNNTAKAIADSYTRTQQVMIENFAKVSDMFELDEVSIPGTTLIKAKFSLYSLGEITAGGVGEDAPGGVNYLYQLLDVPDYRTLYSGKYLRVKSDGSGLEWVDVQGGASAFDDLTGRPKYNGSAMTSSTNIPEVKTSVWDAKQNAITDSNKLAYSLISGTPTSLPASDVYDWAKAQTKPSYTLDEITDGTSRKWSDKQDALSNASVLAGITSAKITAWDSAYQKPPTGIPTADIANGAITLAKLSQAVQDILGYFTLEGEGTASSPYYLHTIYNLCSDNEITAGGVGTGGGGGGGVSAIYIKAGSSDYRIDDTTTRQARFGVKVNGTPVAPDTDGYLNISTSAGTVTQVKVGTTAYNPVSGVVSLPAYPTVPTALSQLSADATHRLVTDTQITAWNAKQNALGYTPVNKAGDTMNGVLTISPVNISGNQNGLILHDSGPGDNESLYIKWTSSSYTSGITLSSNSDKTQLLVNNTYTVYHSGNLTAATLGLGNVENKSSATIRGELTATNVTNALGNTAVAKATDAVTLDGQHASYFATASSLGNYLPLSGGTMTGDIVFKTESSNWNFGHTESKVRLLTSGGTAATGAPAAYYGGLSAISSYCGFQLVTYGGASNDLLFRKIVDSDTWLQWNTLYHSGNSNNTSTPWSASVLSVNKVRILGTMSSSNVGYGVYYYNGTTDYCLIAQGSANLWIGASETVGTHHPGSTYISAGTGTLYASKFVGGTRANYEIYDAANANKSNVAWNCSNLTASGSIVASGEITAGSDARWKHNITPVLNGIDAIMKLQPCTWEWNSDNHKGSGFVAQQVQSVIPHLVKTDNEGYLHLTYDGLHAYEISAIQSHETRIQQLERENAELKMEIQRLRN